MTQRTLVWRSLRFRWRAHLGVLLGAAVGSAVLTGALIVGDSVRGSLREQALARLGWIWFALSSQDRFVTDTLPERMPGGLPDSWRLKGGNTSVFYATRPAGILTLPATVARQDQTARAGQVNLIGVGYEGETAEGKRGVDFWSFAPQPPSQKKIPAGDVWLNEALAGQLHAQPGDALIVRLQKPGALSLEATLTPQAGAQVSARVRVGRVLNARELGNFSLRASQVPPLNAYLDLGMLQSLSGTTGRVNLLMAPEVVKDENKAYYRVWGLLSKIGLAKLADHLPLRRSSVLASEEALSSFQEDLKAHLTLADLEASFRPVPGPDLELISRRIFLDEPLARSALASNTAARPLLTYFVNQFRAGTNTTPYSMVTAAGPPWTPAGLQEDEIVVNQWLADDLRLRAGDSLDLSYFLPDSGSRLAERTNRFRVRAIVPLAGLYADPTLMPEFPGLAKAESTQDWDAGFPLVHRIRDRDEQYWKEHRGTPKAFITLAAGQKMWANRFGPLTAIRFPNPAGNDSSPAPLRGTVAPIASTATHLAPAAAAANFRENLEKEILGGLRPAEVGLSFQPVREQALNAAAQSQDFGGLFIGFSFFLIAAALILMALLFQFGLEQRSEETGTLLALGFTARQVRRLLLQEGVALALAGGAVGAFGGIGYARLMLRGLTTIWREAIGTSALSFFVTPLTLLTGLLAAALVSTAVAWWVLRKQARAPARELLSGASIETLTNPDSKQSSAVNWGKAVGLICLGAGLAIAAGAWWKGQTSNAGAFFGAGSLCLVGALGCFAWWLRRLNRGGNPSRLNTATFALRNCTRRRTRSLAVAALLACGLFIVASISVFRLDARQEAWKRSSGTGGFALLGQSALPVLKALETAPGREALGLDEKALDGVSFVPFRVRDGDDASCLNLNRAQQPRVLGVNPKLLAERQAFSFAAVAKGEAKAAGWRLLWKSPAESPSTNRAPGTIPEIPAIGDAASIQWALHKEVGDTLDYTDEAGRRFRLRLVGALANSILQGSLIIDEQEFTRCFPGESGYRFFLIDAPSNRLEAVAATLSRELQDLGLELTPAARRLDQFNAVQNTYLNTFQILGGLGLLLGSAGLGVVVLRNALERRGELALLLAVGWRRRQVFSLVLLEHLALLGAGLAAGLGAALVAVAPALQQAVGRLPGQSLGLTLAVVLLTGMIATFAGTHSALRGSLLESLRNE